MLPLEIEQIIIDYCFGYFDCGIHLNYYHNTHYFPRFKCIDCYRKERLDALY